MKDILGSHSTEIQQLFYAIETVSNNISAHIETLKTTLAAETFLSNHEVCKLLIISPRTLQDYRDKGRIAYYKLEGKILYAMSDIKRMLDKNYCDVWKLKR